MKETVIKDVNYLVGAAPIMSVDKDDFIKWVDEGSNVFIVNLVVESKPRCGTTCLKVVGAVEAITGKRICDFVDGPSKEYGRGLFRALQHGSVELNKGEAYFKVNLATPAEMLVTEEVIKEYFNQTPEMIEEKFELLDKACKEIEKSESLSLKLTGYNC